MTDRELSATSGDERMLLELAAKAAGYRLCDYTDVYHDDIGRIWKPLTDDGDALRLAVKLKIEITTYPKSGEVGAGRSANLVGFGKHGRVFEYFGNDPYAATRRAIVRAAAEIGKDL